MNRSDKDKSVLRFLRANRRVLFGVLFVALVAALLVSLTEYESYTSLYDAAYVGSEGCADCHTQIYPSWQRSPHANMTRKARAGTVVGDFSDRVWWEPGKERVLPAARMHHLGDRYWMDLRDPKSNEYHSFPIEYVVGYQYRQVYLTRERGGVLRRLPLQWSTERRDFFPYWNFQERSEATLEDLWSQMTTLNSAWNLFCARCHTTKLNVESKDANHRMAVTHWVDDGIACEACHGPGGQHVNYMDGNPINRIVAWLNNRVRGQPVAYIANAARLQKGEALSVCARCHGSDIKRSTMDTYRLYEPGYSRAGRINDLSSHFREAPLLPNQNYPTLETWADARPKGIGMLFRTFIESACYQQGEIRCYDCHDPHDNKQAAAPGMLAPTDQSNAWCLGCHTELADDTAAHSRHAAGTEGSYCYDCHMAPSILNAATGVRRLVRSHMLSEIPNPGASLLHGIDAAPNACNSCHTQHDASWAAEALRSWQTTLQAPDSAAPSAF
ncbi:MAG: multiheme c-type cytochrome [Gammaproteobacteria bacterium]|nr:multiheme c-type cytochrome [Gammaproteobacteria bacterium]MDH3768203.1 multiheme c-type cytochrome [Gammaproteobacteria bacterium]